MRYLVAGIFLFQNNSMYSQMLLDREINFAVRSMPLEEVLNKLQQEYYILFSYGFDNVTGKTPISIEAQSISVYDLLHELGRQADVEFIIVGTTVVFRRRHIVSLREDETLNTVKRHLAIGSFDPADSVRLVQRNIVFPLHPIPAAKYVYIPVVMRLHARRYTMGPSPCAFHFLLLQDLNNEIVIGSHHSGHTLNTGHRIGAAVAYQPSARTLIVGTMSLSLKDSASRQMYYSGPQNIHHKVSLAWTYSLARIRKATVGLSATFTYSAPDHFVRYIHTRRSIYTSPLPAVDTHRNIYSGMVCLEINQRLGGKGSIYLKGQYGLHAVRPSEDVPASIHVLSLAMGFRYIFFMHSKRV
jgi:hypothetical protein